MWSDWTYVSLNVSSQNVKVEQVSFAEFRFYITIKLSPKTLNVVTKSFFTFDFSYIFISSYLTWLNTNSYHEWIFWEIIKWHQLPRHCISANYTEWGWWGGGRLLYNWALCPVAARDMTCLSPLRKYGNLRITTYKIVFIGTNMVCYNKKYIEYNNCHNAAVSYISSKSKRAFKNPFMKLLNIETARG